MTTAHSSFPTETLHQLLKDSFGYDSFRPLQEDIIQTSLAGRDVVAILPTGAGKSICYQLPALAREGLTLVVSPLIALMKDQVDALVANGVRATLLNSTLERSEAQKRVSALAKGDYDLLYVSPERVMSPGFIEQARSWGVSAVAIDEAHCVSEWGHDFRPEYRQLSRLRKSLPGVPFLAFTATATEHVRADLVKQLGLVDPEVFVASFNRANLSYAVVPKSQWTAQVRDFIAERGDESGIIYLGSRKRTEELANTLKAHGISAEAYHAGLETRVRAERQDAFLRDRIKVMCATVAFGMGIDKPNVRFVIHGDLPKNIESYYQETGRAGRDGLPADCLLLFSRGDLGRNLYFLQEMTDATARKVAESQMMAMADYAEAANCRRRDLLAYFGEEWTEENCGACDSCLAPRETWDATVASQKFLSCVVRVREKNGFGTGMNHLVAVLTGGNTQNIRKWGHETLSTYGIGRDMPRNEWADIGRQLTRLGYAETSGEYQTVDITEQGMQFLHRRTTVNLVRPAAHAQSASSVARAGSVPCDEGLFQALRLVRSGLAEERGVPPFVVFGDITLRHIAREYPADKPGLLAISGVGNQKLRDFGEPVLAAVAEWLTENERQTFAPLPKPKPRSKAKEGLSGSALETADFIRSGKSLDEVVAIRGFARSTIQTHVANAVAAGILSVDPREYYSEAEEARMAAAVETHGSETLRPIFEALNEEFDYGTIRMFVAIRSANK